MNDVRDVIIIGGGPAGYTAALYTARANLSPLVIEGFNWGGQLMITSDVENYPGYADGVLGPAMMSDFRRQAERFGAEFMTDDVTSVDFSERPFRVLVGSDEYRADAVIVATGASARQLGLSSEQTLQGRGVSYCATCDGAFFRDKVVVVAGGGDSAMEEATFLARFARKVVIVHRRDEFRASPIMVDRARANEKIEFVLNAVVEEVVGEGAGESPASSSATRSRATAASSRPTGSSSRSGTIRRRRSSSTGSTTTTRVTSSPSLDRHGRTSRAYSPPAMSRITRTARRSPPPARERWRRSTHSATSRSSGTDQMPRIGIRPKV